MLSHDQTGVVWSVYAVLRHPLTRDILLWVALLATATAVGVLLGLSVALWRWYVARR
jgi:hypothetical protein